MNKEVAARKIGISVRTLQRYMSAHRIAFTMKRTKTGEVADFNKAEVERLKYELKEGMTTPVTHGIVEPSEPVMALTVRDEQGQQRVLAPVELMQSFGAMFQAMQSQVAPQVASVSVENKLMLSLAEASQLSGISVGVLRAAVHAGKLTAHKGIGRGLGKVKRDDLLAYVKKL
jgi:excisionase family DNA binding protein